MGRRVVGLDIGYLNLRAVALEAVKGGYRLVGHAQVSRFDDLGQRKALPRAIEEIDSRLRLRGRVVVSSSELATMVRFEHNDPMPADRLDRVLRLELSQHAGGDGDIAADAKPIPLDGDELIHCCGLAQPPQVLELMAELRKTGVAVDSVDLAVSAGANAMRYQVLSEEEEGQFGLVIDIGARATRVCLMRGRDFLACRQLTYGGDSFTEELARARDLRFEDAEQVKVGLAVADTMRMDVSSLRDEAPAEIDPDEGIAVDEASLRNADSDRLALVDEDDEDSRHDLVLSGDSDRLALVDDDDGEAEADEEGSDRIELELDPGLDVAADLAPDLADPSAGSAGGSDRLDLVGGAEPEAKEPSASWKRSDAGFLLDEPDVPDPGSQTLEMGGAAMGPELTRSAEHLYAQVAKTVSWFQAQLRLREIDVGWIRLAGGGADLIGLTPYLRRRFDAPVSPLNPFANLTERPPMAPQAFTLAVGLALSGHPEAISFDLRPESLQRKSVFWGQVVWPRVAAALLAAATVLAAVAIWLDQHHDQARFDRYDQQRQRHQSLMSQREALIAERDGMLTDLKGVASRIFGGRDLLYAIRAFKQEAPQELWITELSTTDPRLSDARGAGPRGGTGGRGARGGARTTRGADPAAPEVREDTLIDTVFIRGFVKPDAGRDAAEIYGTFVRWYESLVDWRPEPEAKQLFSTHKVREFDAKREAADVKGRYPFDIYFALQPTTWNEVAELMDDEEAAP